VAILKKKIDKKVVHNKQISGELPISFRKKVYNLLKNLFSLFKAMHFLCTTSLNISYKNQPLLLSLGGCLEEKKNRQISGA